LKREVIIVITPFVLPEGRVASRTIPKDDDAFDSFDNELFRSAYRIRDQDVFDLRFLTENLQLKRMQMLADQVNSQNAEVAEKYPFDRFTANRIPGERILVFRQMYEVIKRREIAENVDIDRLIYLQPDENVDGMGVQFFWTEVKSRLGLTREATLTPERME